MTATTAMSATTASLRAAFAALLPLAAGTCHALSCAIATPALVAGMWGQVDQVFTGRLLTVGPPVSAPLEWTTWRIATLEVERWHKGSGPATVETLVSADAAPGARLLVFARAADEGRRAQRAEQWRVQRRSGTAPRTTAAAPPIPALDASSACNQNSVELDGGDLAQTYLTGLAVAQRPAGRNRLILDVVADYRGRGELARAVFVPSARPAQLRLTGPGVERHYALQWLSRAAAAERETALVIDDLPPGRYRLEPSSYAGFESLCGIGPGMTAGPWQASPCEQFDVGADAPVIRSLRLQPDSRTEFALEDRDGRPLELRAAVRLRPTTPTAPPAGDSIVGPAEYLALIGPGSFALHAPNGLYDVELIATEARHRPTGAAPGWSWPWEEVRRHAWKPPASASASASASAPALRLRPGSARMTLRLPADLRPVRLTLELTGCDATTTLTIEPVLSPGPARIPAHPRSRAGVAPPNCTFDLVSLPHQTWQAWIQRGHRSVELPIDAGTEDRRIAIDLDAPASAPR